MKIRILRRHDMFKPGRWYQILDPDGNLWMETSDREEAEAEAIERGWTLWRQYISVRTEWRVWRPEGTPE